MGDFMLRAQSLQRAPTGLWIRHFGQIGVSQRLQRSAVSTSGFRGHITTWVIVDMVPVLYECGFSAANSPHP
ncbi:hypothetical protein AYO38_06845 [bacterium SCGC AG-212-C10]|nr:hypothetical protein AYO38_06845 [bacterium SCGC AG-212-C10]